MANLFVGSLAYSTTDESLQEAVSAIAPVKSAKVITDRDSGRSKGFAFVELEDEADNQKVIDALNGKELDGRTINVTVARPREDKPRGGGNYGNNGGGSFRKREW